MGAGLSSSLERRERRRWEKGNRKAIAKAHPLPEQQEDSSVTEITGPMIVTGSIDADQGRPERLPRITLPKERKDAPPMPAQEGGILNNAQGVHIEGVPTFNNVHIHNTIVQPDSDPKKDAQLLKEATEWLSDVNYHAIQTDSYGKRAAGTGEWAFDDPIISKWLDGALGILWGVGMRTSCVRLDWKSL
ncbi:hypothetical protein FA15DRAFT_85307 [Coprinopsis marcescibilis]|uniref:Uncharacterized protein n=1 Tax=Coprinopsis marcescibilis TaxID=230819 RepID=A0A5C3KZ91_COPMA|nr:hypothetical protein FA15DRAFT_85307 [Coprinopsis marcescibilis]